MNSYQCPYHIIRKEINHHFMNNLSFYKNNKIKCKLCIKLKYYHDT